MNALKLRIILIIGLVLLIAGVGAGAWWMQNILATYVVATDHAKIDAQVASQQLERLRFLESELKEKKDIVERADQIAATANNYQYQDQIVKDLTVYANRNGIAIAGFNFTATAGQGAQGPSGTTRTSFTVALNGPLEFSRFMQFLRDIENNLTKLQVTSLALSPDEGNPKMVTNPTLGLVVYLKK